MCHGIEKTVITLTNVAMLPCGESGGASAEGGSHGGWALPAPALGRLPLSSCTMSPRGPGVLRLVSNVQDVYKLLSCLPPGA